MNHRKTWFFLSGLYISIELAVLIAFVLTKSYVGYFVAGVMALFICFELFRIYRKTQVITRDHHLTQEQKSKRNSNRNQPYGIGTTTISGIGSLTPNKNTWQKSSIKP
jgi:uncharacterized membrane-anchored protein YitT (DUF2179 family)